MTTINKPPTGGIQTLLQDVLQLSIIENPSTVHVIRKNARPVMIESETLQDNTVITKISEHYNIPSHIIAEILSNAQMIGFLDGATKTVSNETMQSNIDKTKESLITTFIDAFTAPKSQITPAIIDAFDRFFTMLAGTTVIKTINKQIIQKKDMPRGIIRQISLFDMDYKNTFSTIQERLDFIIVNIIEQDNFFGKDYATMIQENGGLPVDDIIGKETTMLSSSGYYGKISTIKYEGQSIDALMRIIPGFSPVGIDIMAGLDLPNGNQNYFATIGIQFNTHENQTIPAIHTIQMSTHNIGATEGGKLVSIKEPYDTNTVTMKQRMRIINAFTNSVYDFDGLRNELVDISHAGLPAEIISYLDKNTLQSIKGKYTIKNNHMSILGTNDERKKVKDTLINAVIENLRNDGILPLLASTINYLFSHGYPAIIIHHASKNMRLQQHNQNRSEQSIAASGDNLYAKKAKQLGGVQNSDGDYIITPESYFAAMNNTLYGHHYVDMGKLIQAKNEVFTPYHPATTKLFDIQDSIDSKLLEIFIQSPTYNAR